MSTPKIKDMAGPEEELETPRTGSEHQARPAREGAATLDVPSRSSTRSSSPVSLSTELKVMIYKQQERLEAIKEVASQIDESSEGFTQTEVDALSNELENIHLAFKADHDKLIGQLSPTLLEHPYFSTKLAQTEQKQVLTLKRRLGRLKDLSTPVHKEESAAAQMLHDKSRSRLPELVVPNFTSSYSEWPHFRALFTALIIDRKGLDDLERFQYLSGAVSGDAAAIIAGFPPEPASFKLAWERLKARFENKRLILENQYRRVQEFAALPVRGAKALSDLVNLIYETKQTQKFCGIDETPDSYMLCNLVSLLDADTREHWEEHLGNTQDFPTLLQLAEFLEGRARVLEKLNAPVPASSSVPARTSKPRATAYSTQATSGQRNLPTSTSHRSEFPCDCCGGDHFIASCSGFRKLPLQKRVEKVRTVRLCVNCLGRHNVAKCRSRIMCRTCDEAHHTLLHGADIRRVVNPEAEHHQAALQRASQTSQGAGPSTATQSSSSKK